MIKMRSTAYNSKGNFYRKYSIPWRCIALFWRIDMDKEVTIAICMGSSCFARGNNRLLVVLEEAIKENGWEEKIHLSGLRCQELCNEGPIITINGQTYRGLDGGSVLDLLVKILGVAPDVRTYSSVRKNTIQKER